jgi:glycosyltransferase involved in cell wall biosynthesis
VNSSELCDYLRRHAADFDRVVAGPYLFGLTLAVAAIQPDKTSLVPCLHDEPFACLPSVARMFRETPRVLFNSRPERNLACRIYGIDPSRTSVVGMGIDPVDIPPGAAPKCPASSVIYCGRREPLKGTPLLVDYMTAFRSRTRRDVKLVLTGSGPVDVPADMQPHVIDMGLLSEEQKWAAMSSATVFCHPSRNESLGIVLLEAWLAGTPALVRADSEVLRDHCERSNGGLWFNTYPEFEEELMLLLQNESLRKAMSAAGNSYVRREYSWENIQEKLLAALDG